MTTQAEFAQQLRDLNGTLAEINTDQQALLDKITALDAKIVAGDTISQEVEDEFASLKAGMEAAAEKVPTPLDPAAAPAG